MKTVYVVAWEYDGGGGFNWYTQKNLAESAYLGEMENADSMPGSNWVAASYTITVADGDAEEMTAEIDRHNAVYFDHASTLKYQPSH